MDSTGAGEPIFEHFRRARLYVDAYAFTQRSKAALIDGLSIRFEKKLITLPKPQLWPEGIDELEAFEYSVTDAGNVKTGSPSGYHDDCVIAVALAARLVPPPSGPPKTGCILPREQWTTTIPNRWGRSTRIRLG